MQNKKWIGPNSCWLELKPHRDFNKLRIDDESIDEYYKRIEEAGFHIPLSVIEQWLYPHYSNPNTTKNYSWINHKSSIFVETSLSVSELKGMYIIEEYRPYVKRRSQARPFDEFMCIPKDLEHWKLNNTWRIPPIVMDMSSFTDIPSYVESGKRLQLIEGHSRLGYLLALNNAKQLKVQNHKVFLLRD